MKSRPLPRPMVEDGYVRRKMLSDRQVQVWTQRLLADQAARPTDLTEEQLTFVMESVLVKRKQDFSPDEYEKAMSETTPILAAPDITDWVSDMRALLNQPEMVDFWRRWTVPPARKGPKPAIAQGKAFLTAMAISGISSHADDIHSILQRDAGVREVFAEIEEQAPSIDEPEQFDSFPPYSTVMRVKDRVVGECHWLAMQTNIRLIRELAKLYPNAGIGKRLMVDACSHPAWTQQRAGAGDTPELRKADDAFLRRRVPEAGFRMYGYSAKNGGKSDIKRGDSVEGSKIGANKVRRWRGYYLCLLVDQATGLPLVWHMMSAKQHEPTGLIPMLSWLYELWPECPAELIAGDSYYDEQDTCALLEASYGLHPVFRLHDDRGGMLFATAATEERKRASRDARLPATPTRASSSAPAMESRSRSRPSIPESR